MRRGRGEGRRRAAGSGCEPGRRRTSFSRRTNAPNTLKPCASSGSGTILRSFAPVRPFFFGPITWISARVSAFGATATGTAVVTTGNASAVEGIALSNVTVDTHRLDSQDCCHDSCLLSLDAGIQPVPSYCTRSRDYSFCVNFFR